ncbi:dihydrolipoamide dehydrogenase [Candidatus Kryptonium thompsonii]|jgi:dihydrolipoamide dehydrogenase|uniref:Dihydrolipoyl dehydrogenase n=2 Tax=Candidatus Kryptonium thompsonii TaxID=1633631 RepID=A0A0P1LFC7_9BACT|nr:dihydrolipoyl dehydrogenase [Candidatus Kryptonium thompsoni]CUS79920.1 dihydrolipoamide dehydrogenase [Candidatus Kryptonium thompsoni]CUS82091.1 dihydrolipoamide dehydrogenase [Candidatus Kryptonium thompsoni]CUS84206.1 dihydrolipoamide dehydrogenase [Candidatus Kryptonium thompsoni]CUS98042.1 dihydrolipoamide dehydrogenase [Candidatus Kryptonium thompsoni]CUT02664.1 dihydrolipoamide dehydrogenase [Candidatus Kryptonium thompsoni]
MPEKFDVVIIGGGPGGYVAAIRASQLGFKTALIEKDRVGGICLNWGCIPTKALLKSAELYNLMKRADEFGLKLENLAFDFKKVIQRSRQVAERLTRGVEFLLKKNNVTKISGEGFILKQNVVGVKGDKDEMEIESRNIIIATGARPREIPGIKVDGKFIITSKEAMLLEEPPKSMIIIGAGAIGVEFAYFYNSFGTKITLIEMMPSILPNEDKEITDILAKSFQKSGIEILTETKVISAVQEDNSAVVKIERKNGEEILKADVALVAIGVRGNTDGIGLENVGVEVENTFIKVDKKTYKTNVDGIYAIGDVIGPPLLAHAASAEGIRCVENIAGVETLPVDYNGIPSCTYCIPQVASIGLTEQKAIELGYEIRVGRFPFRANGKALALGETEGIVKVIFDAKYGELLGAHIIGPEATELIAEFGVVKTLEGTAFEIAKTIHAHPTLSETLMEASADSLKEAIHI